MNSSIEIKFKNKDCKSFYGEVSIDVNKNGDIFYTIGKETFNVKNILLIRKNTIHTLRDRINGINSNCTLSQAEIKNCFGYQMIGERACDNKIVPSDDIKRKICKWCKK